MSSMYWRPGRPPEDPEQVLPDHLKHVLAKRIWRRDGSCNESPVSIDRSWLDYLAGLEDAGVEGADFLIMLIGKHGSVEIWIEN